MKFAVIEYSSKSGAIWKHTPARPNYLCDPQKEIDPTSFGCYVSALQGEHIPLTALIAPGLVSKFRKRLTGSWPAYSLDYLKNFDVVMIVHQISDGHEVTAATGRLKHLIPHLFIMGVATQPYGLLKSYWESHSDWLADFRVFMNTCDVYVSIVKETVPAWQQLTSRPVVYVPQPYPAAFALQYFTPRAQKQPIIFVAGVSDRPAITKGMSVAKQLQQEFPEYSIHVTKIAGSHLDVSTLAGARFEVRPFENWQQHLQSQRKVTLVINTDYTFTRGRVQTDCAAVGTPSVGANSDGQYDLFPELASTPATSTTELLAMGRKLLKNEAYYMTTAAYARDRLQLYDYELSANRIAALVKKYA